jgi:hypothetical protein
MLHALMGRIVAAAPGAEEWRDIQWAHGGMRQLDERAPTGGYLHIKGKTHVCSTVQPLLLCCSRKPARSTTFADAATSVVQDGDRFWRMPETYVRGNTIKYLRVPNEVSHERCQQLQ